MKKLRARGRKIFSSVTKNRRRPPLARRPSVVMKVHWRWRLLFLCLLAGSLVCAVYGTWASLFDLEDLKKMPQRTMVYDYKGRPYSRLSGEDRVLVPIDQISPFFIKALLAREDTRFYKHYGIDPIGIARAVVRNIIHRRGKEGASTLTQQLARNSFPLGGKNLHRKLLEAFVAIRIERNFTKKEILESYVNRIYFGSGYWGVETASRAYFGKRSADLTLSEAAVLAGLIRSPQRFSPFRNLPGAIAQRDTVLSRMQKLGYITLQQQADAVNEEVVVNSNRPPGAVQSYAMELVEQELAVMLDEDQLAEGGLRVYTTLDPDLQKAAEEALDRHLAKIEQRPGYSHPKRADFVLEGSKGTPYLQGAVIVLDNATGGIRAVVGGRSYAESRYNRALLASRQVGSTFKPFVYAAAYANGAVNPSTGISDGPIRRGEIKSDPRWTPGNSDGKFGGVMPAEEGLVLSRNTMSVRVGDLAGLQNVRKMGEKAGLGELPNFASIYLGSFESTLKTMTSAYTIFPNGGVRRQPFVIVEVKDPAGHVLYKASRVEQRVLEKRVAGMVNSGLVGVMQRGTAAGANFKYPAAGKTGTTNDYRDAWFIGYTRSLTCGVWVGLDKPTKIMAKGYGGTLALPIWCEVMNASVQQQYPTKEFDKEKPQQQPKERLPGRVIRSFRHLFER